jgi:hypothetical protein
MKTRNPVAGNSWRYNKSNVIGDKKKQTVRGGKHNLVFISESYINNLSRQKAP